MEREFIGKDHRSNWDKRQAEDSYLNMLRRKQELREEFARMQGHVPMLSPCQNKGLRFKVSNDGDMLCKISEKGPKKTRRGKRSKPKNKMSVSDMKKMRRTNKFEYRTSPMSSSEEE